MRTEDHEYDSRPIEAFTEEKVTKIYKLSLGDHKMMLIYSADTLKR